MDDVTKLIEYCRGIAQEFDARLRRMGNFLSRQPLTIGQESEAILRGFLATIAPKRYQVTQGFICNPTKINSVSKQCDILIYDQIDYPLVHSEGEVRIVWPDSAKLVIEVKTKLDKTQLYGSIENIISAKQTQDMTVINGLVFAFESELKPDRIIRLLREQPLDKSIRNFPNVILILEHGLIVTTGRWQIPLRESHTYTVHQSEDKGVLLTYLFLYFLFNTSGGLLDATIMNAMRSLIDTKTQTINDRLVIGENKSR